MKSKITIRRVDPDTLTVERIKQLIKVSYGDNGLMKHRLLGFVDGSNIKVGVYIAYFAGTIIGWALTSSSSKPYARTSIMFYTKVKHRRKGIATRLLKLARSYEKKKLYAYVSNAKAFFKKNNLQDIYKY